MRENSNRRQWAGPKKELADHLDALAREGFALEPASAVAVACARREVDAEHGNETWIAIGTGSTVKWPQSICAGFLRPPELPDDVADADKLIAEAEEPKTPPLF